MSAVGERQQVDLESTAAGAAIVQLAVAVASQLGTGASDADGENDGDLDAPVEVTTTGVLGSADAVSTMDDRGVVTVHVDDTLDPILQLRAILGELEAHCISRFLR